MKKVTDSERQRIINEVINFAHKKAPEFNQKLLKTFIEKYYANAAIEDLEERSLMDLCGAVISHWELAYKRAPEELKLRVYNPDYETNGWQSTHTIIELSYVDIPFVVDSIRMEINRLGMMTHMGIHVGGLNFKRNAKHEIVDILSITEEDKNARIEAVTYMEIDKQTDPLMLKTIEENLLRVLHDACLAVEDWQAMRDRVAQLIEHYENTSVPLPKEEVDEAKAFLVWMLDNHFTLLGSRDYKLVGTGEEQVLKLIPNSSLGVLRETQHSKEERYYSEMPEEARKLALSKQIIILSTTKTKSTIHRPNYTNDVTVRLFDSKGHIVGQCRIIGHYTSDVYHSHPRVIPLIRRKVEKVIELSGWQYDSHAGRALINILESLPRGELFQASVQELYDLSIGILQLQERKRIRLFVRRDAYNRYISCLVYIPRDNFNTELRYKMQRILEETFGATEITFATHFSESVLCRVHFMVRTDPRKELSYNVKKLEKQLAEIGRSWTDELQEDLLEHFGEEKGNILVDRYLNTFPAGYREVFAPRSAVYDIEHLDKLTEDNKLEMSFYRPLGAASHILRFKLFHIGHTIPLSDVLPMLENMGLRVIGEQPYRITLQDGTYLWINDFNMEYPRSNTFNLEEIKDNFQEAFRKVWYGEAENDLFNSLVISAALSWREISVLRAYAKYLRQIGVPFSQQYIEETLVGNPVIAALLVQYFKTRFLPSKRKAAKENSAKIEEMLIHELDAVANLDQDRIIRQYLNVIEATIRTNYFQVNEEEQPKSYLSFKFKSRKIQGLPQPYPKFEIFVYSPRVEGIHLRGASVARGGIRWSDRREDFRTEVLGLMKAQQVKNAVIVPSGAKGGFVVKSLALLSPDASREMVLEEGIACYQIFIRGLLDITDNIIDQEIVPPDNTVRYDEDDPYLVVAADKGTATFSDIANNISKEYDFWLYDAFASGGSTGYDHKKIAITARGAWESVKRHFRELGTNINTTDFTVIGIGDMAGDVFGNGMLLSDHIKLVGAFNHHHIFLDPNPDAKTSFKERQRLFNLPRSSWEDYDASLISAGGGVFKRSLKSIPLSPEVKKLLDIKKDALQPNELIRAMLKAKVDLVWNGGIGTYVKASTEDNAEVGDRSNDALRINGNELWSRVVAEGGNLGLTQLGRIEYEFNEGKINTDFIDNSGGVDCSDHEVNIKILLNGVVTAGDMTEKQRDVILAEMTDEVAGLVLDDNYRQNRAISLIYKINPDYIDLYSRYITEQERAGKLDRDLEFLPEEKVILERKAADKGLTRPEIAVLLAYSKIILKEEILASDLLDDAYLGQYVESAFPQLLCKKFRKQMDEHPLRKEIVATQLSNAVVNDMGVAFIYQMQNETGASTPAIVRAYVISQTIFNMPAFMQDIDSLDFQVDADIQIDMMLDVVRLIRRSTRWFLRNWRNKLEVGTAIKHFAAHMPKVLKMIPELLQGEEKQSFETKRQDLMDAKVPEAIAADIAATRFYYAALNIIEAATVHQANLHDVAIIHFTLGNTLGLVWFNEYINTYPVDNQWAIVARASFKDDLDWQHRVLTVSVLTFKAKVKNVEERIALWFELNKDSVERWRAILADLRSTSALEFTMLSVAMRELVDLAQASLNLASQDAQHKSKVETAVDWG
jgi:glutamate dehydrogenase